MELGEDLERIAGVASSYGEVAGVLAAEPASARRFYLVALGEDEARRWIVLDAAGAPVERRDEVRETASIVAMCELAGDLAGGGQLADLREQLVQVRMVEQAPGIEAAEEAALALERVVGAPPRIASPAYLDEVGAATLTLERALGELGSPFSEAIRGATGAIDAFVGEVESGYLTPLG